MNTEPTADNATQNSNPFADRVREEAQNKLSVPEAEPTPEPKPRAEIAILDGHMQITNFDQLVRVSQMIRKSGLCPSSFTNDAQLGMAILRCLELRIPIFQGLEGMVVIKGRIGIMGDLALAIVQASGELEAKKVEYSGEGEQLVCTVTLKRRKRAAQSYSFSIPEAKAAGIAQSNVWRAYPKRMTYYRALGFGLRDEFPDLLKGIKTAEELQDYPENSK